MVDRAYALFVVKGLDLERRTFAGLATTPELDRQGQRVDPAGVSFRNPLPLLFHHDQQRPIGRVTLFPATAAGIAFEASMPVLTDPGPLKDRIDEAWQSIKAGLITGVSIGLRVLKTADRATHGVLDILQSEILELSLVTIPANVQASILSVKSLAASGPHSSGVTDTTQYDRAKARIPMTTIAEQIQTFEASRAAKAARMVALMTTASEAGVTLDASQADEYESLSREVKSTDDHLTRFRELEKLQVTTATAIPTTMANPQDVRTFATSRNPVVSVKPNVRPGTAFIRYCQAKAYGHGDSMRSIEFAKQWHDSTPEVELVLKAAVAPGTINDATWAGPLVQLQPLASEFLAMLRPATVIGNIPNLHKVPFNISVPSQTGGGTYQWVGQGAPKPVCKLAFATLTLGITKCAGIIAITEELAKISSPSAEDVIRADMIAGIAAFLDVEFTDPAKAPVANVSPGSITNGVTPITSAGTSPANGRTDIGALLAALTTAGLSAKGAVLLMSETNASALGGGLNPLGQPLFPSLTVAGGEARGVTVVTSQALGANVIALAPDSVFLADDGGVNIDVSREASVQMDSAPDNPALATTVFTSFWQANLVGLRAERFINWKKARTGCVQYTVQTYVAS
jgi:HK97 family phage prohead protease/HK97 family phage major capsid protein